MFHRVKSEAQPDQIDAQQDQPEVEDTEIESSASDDQDFEDTTEDEASDDTFSASEEATTEDPITEPEPTPTTTEEEEITMNQSAPSTPARPEPSTEAYQRPSAPVQGVGGYPGSYPGYGAANTSSTTSASVGDRRLTIGAGITMSGEIESCDYLLVEGTVEAALKGASVLDIAESGVFYGTVEIADATIAGRFEGDITAHGRLTLREGATVTGTIAYKELEIEAGAVIDGKLTPLSAVPAAEKPRPAEAPVKRPVEKPAAKVESKQPANTDGGLFTKAAATAE